MVHESILSGLKRVNVSSDKEKTKRRVEQLWKSSANELKRDVIRENDLKVGTIYRIFREGAISPKIALLIAEGLGADPFYLTGDTDDRGEYNDSIAERFLQDKGYGDLFDGAKAKKQTRRRVTSKADVTVTVASEPENDADPIQEEESLPSNASVLPAQTMKDIADIMTEDELILLIRALYVRAKYDDFVKINLTTIMQMLIDG